MEAFITTPSVETLAAAFNVSAVYTVMFGIIGAGITFTLVAAAYRKIKGALGGGRVRV